LHAFQVEQRSMRAGEAQALVCHKKSQRLRRVAARSETEASMRKNSRKPGRKRPASRTRKGAAGQPRRYWSAKVTERSDALDLESSVFTRDAAAIARSLKRSAERSTRRKSSPFRSAMSMLTFYQNRAGKSLSPAKKRVITQAKDELRKLYGR
jgi:hypothetical protein